MASLVPLICILSVLLGVIVGSRVSDPRTAQQFGAFVVLPIIAIAVAQFLGGQATFTCQQVLIGDLVVIGLIGALLAIGRGHSIGRRSSPASADPLRSGR